MQIELPETTTGILTANASAEGLPLDQYIADLLANFAYVSARQRVADPDFKIRSHEDAILWVLSRNPGIATNNPYDTDWQAMKAEGRRY